MAYAKARKDFEFLETVVQLNDWVSLMDDLEEFMRKPNKLYAQGLYERGIGLWFQENGTEGHGRRVSNIAERYGVW